MFIFFIVIILFISACSFAQTLSIEQMACQKEKVSAEPSLVMFSDKKAQAWGSILLFSSFFVSIFSLLVLLP